MLTLPAPGTAGSLGANKNLIIDTTPPVTVVTGPASPTNVNPFRVTIAFGESVTGFVLGNVTVAGGTATGLVDNGGGSYTATIDATADGAVSVSVGAGKATDVAGNANVASPVFELVVITSWHNVTDPFDVNGIDGVTPLDALLIINHINSHPGQTGLPPAPVEPHPYYDVNGDGVCTPLDVLLVINYLNGLPVGVAEAEPDSAGTSPVFRTGAGRLPGLRTARQLASLDEGLDALEDQALFAVVPGDADESWVAHRAAVDDVFGRWS